MTRITTTVLILMLLMNGTVTIMAASGLNEDLGIAYTTGVDDQMDDVTAELNGAFSPDVNVIESFVALALAGVRIFGVVIEGVFSAPAMMKNLLGGGAFIGTVVDVLMVPMYIIATLEMVFMATGRDAL